MENNDRRRIIIILIMYGGRVVLTGVLCERNRRTTLQKTQSFSLLSSQPIDDVRVMNYTREGRIRPKRTRFPKRYRTSAHFTAVKLSYTGCVIWILEIDRDKNNKYCYRKRTATSTRAALACHARFRIFTRVRGKALCNVTYYYYYYYYIHRFVLESTR